MAKSDKTVNEVINDFEEKRASEYLTLMDAKDILLRGETQSAIYTLIAVLLDKASTDIK